MSNTVALRLPVVAHGAEFLVMGYLMRRNILTYKAPQNFEGYDLICIHPDPHKQTRVLRIQVKSRYQTDNDRVVLVKKKTFPAFDFLVMVFQNIGYYSWKGHDTLEGGFEEHKPEFYCFPNKWLCQHHKPSWGGKVPLSGLEEKIERFKNEKGFELIAERLKIPYPTRKKNRQTE
jgi:hypothetical protein